MTLYIFNAHGSLEDHFLVIRIPWINKVLILSYLILTFASLRGSKLQKQAVPYRYSLQYIDLAEPKSRAPDFITIIQVNKNFKVVYASQNAVAIRFRAKRPSAQTTRNFVLVCLWYGRSGGRSVYGHVIAKFSRMGSLPHFLPHVAPRARAPL